jgi:hypothetical protein
MIRLASPIRSDETKRIGGKRTRAVTMGALNSAARSGLCTAQFLGTASKNTKITTTSNTAPTSTPMPPSRCSATTPTRVADTSWQMSTSRRIGLRNLAGCSTRRASWRAPRRFSSTIALALIRFMRTRLVSARASRPEAASRTAMTTTRTASSVWKPGGDQRPGTGSGRSG